MLSSFILSVVFLFILLVNNIAVVALAFHCNVIMPWTSGDGYDSNWAVIRFSEMKDDPIRFGGQKVKVTLLWWKRPALDAAIEFGFLVISKRSEIQQSVQCIEIRKFNVCFSTFLWAEHCCIYIYLAVLDSVVLLSNCVFYCVAAECLTLRQVLRLVRTLIKLWKRCSTESCYALSPSSTNPCSAVNDNRMTAMISPAAAANACLVAFWTQNIDS